MIQNKCILDSFILKSKKEISVGTVSFYTNQIYCIILKNDILIGIREIEEIATATKEITGGVVPFLNLIIAGERTNISTDAFSFDVFKNLNITQPIIAEAVVMQNIATRIVLNFYFKVNKRNYPLKMFENKEKAIAWLLSKAV